MGWLQEQTDWLKQAIHDVWESFTDWSGDFLLAGLEQLMEWFREAAALVPVPDWMIEHSLSSIYAQLDPTTQWAFQTFRLPESLLLIGLGYGIRLTRKLLTLGQW